MVTLLPIDMVSASSSRCAQPEGVLIGRVFGTFILRYSQIQHVKDGINAKNSLESGQYRSGRIVSPLTKQIVLQGFGWPLPLEVRRASRVFIAL